MYVSLEQKKPFAATRDILPQKQKSVAFFFSPQKFRFSDTIFFSLSASFQFFLFCPSFNEKPFLFSNLHHNVLNFDTMLRCLFEYSEETHAAKNLVLVHSLSLEQIFLWLLLLMSFTFSFFTPIPRTCTSLQLDGRLGIIIIFNLYGYARAHNFL